MVVQDQERLARVFKALSDETRLRLVAELAQRGEVTCGEFAALCACSPSALTYHQRILSEAGLIAVRRAGQYRVLTLQAEALEAVLPGFLARLARSAPGGGGDEDRSVAVDPDAVMSGRVARPLHTR